MAGIKKTVIRAGLEALYFSRAHWLAGSFLAGMGAILMFHHVRPSRTGAFRPNRHLEISPEFLDEIITTLGRADVDIVSLDEVHLRLIEGDRSRRFIALTFDDGYRDNLEFAWPVLKRHRVPFAIYVASAFADGQGDLWWLMLEDVIARMDRIEIGLDGKERVFACATAQDKNETWATLYRWLRGCDDEATVGRVIRDIARLGGVDMAEHSRALCMGWDELARMAEDPLMTIGGHTVNHVVLTKVDAATARAEIAGGVARIEEKLGLTPRHFAYPVGDRSAAGAREFAIAEPAFKTAVTTRPGVVFAEHANYLTALPRISVNGEFQRMRYLDALLSGAPTALWNGFRRVDAA